MKNLGMCSFWRFLDDCGTTYWWIPLKFGMEVEDLRVYDIFRFLISKIFGFYKYFPKSIGFSKFWGFKSQNFEILR